MTAADRKGNRAVPTVLVANPSPDLYGSDLQLLHSISAMTDAGWRVVVAIPERGALTERMIAMGAELEVVPFPVLRRASASPRGLVLLAWTGVEATLSLWKVIRRIGPSAVYVNTVTLPWWLLAARLARTPCLCHIHEAEARDSRTVRSALTAPLNLATVVVPNSRTSLDVLCDVFPRLRSRASVVYNGVPGPVEEPRPPLTDRGCRLIVVGRLSPRKAPDVALEAVALLRAQGRLVTIELCGSTFEGYEWFEKNLRARAAQPDLVGSVVFSGYVSPTWSALERSDIVLAPSLGESFGNAVVEGQLALRPVVVTALQGHLETVTDEVTGLLVPPGDAAALGSAVARLIDDRQLATALAAHGRANALANFSVERYRAEILTVLTSLCGSTVHRRRGDRPNRG